MGKKYLSEWGENKAMEKRSNIKEWVAGIALVALLLSAFIF